MKLFNLSLIATVFGQSPTHERKIPPRTPEQRLTFLTNQLQKWISDNFSERRPGRTGNFAENIEDQIIDRIDQAFSGRKCAKWSKEWPNGGPDPNGPMAGMKWKDYRKELVIKLDARELAKAEKKANQEQTRRKRDVNIRTRRTLEMLESINEDVFDEYFNNAAKDGERSAGVALERELSADQRVRLYQILVSYMKWAFRYMGECPQDAAGTHAVRMYDFVENQLLDLYEYIQSRTNDQ